MIKLIKGLDLRDGDIVQITRRGPYTGRVGEIIGCKLSVNSVGKTCLQYTIKLSDKKSIGEIGKNLKLIKPADY